MSNAVKTAATKSGMRKTTVNMMNKTTPTRSEVIKIRGTSTLKLREKTFPMKRPIFAKMRRILRGFGILIIQ